MAGISSSEDERFRNALQTNPSEAISYLYDKYSKSLFRYAFMITKDEEHAKDIVQDAIVHIWKNRKKFSRGHTQSIHHYLVKSVRRRSLTYFRRAIHIDWTELSLSELPINYSTVEVAIVESEVIREIRHAISRFPKRERECLLMKIDKGMTPDDIATNLGVTRKAVERAITSANKRLRAWATIIEEASLLISSVRARLDSEGKIREKELEIKLRNVVPSLMDAVPKKINIL